MELVILDDLVGLGHLRVLVRGREEDWAEKCGGKNRVWSDESDPPGAKQASIRASDSSLLTPSGGLALASVSRYSQLALFQVCRADLHGQVRSWSGQRVAVLGVLLEHAMQGSPGGPH